MKKIACLKPDHSMRVERFLQEGTLRAGSEKQVCAEAVILISNPPLDAADGRLPELLLFRTRGREGERYDTLGAWITTEDFDTAGSMIDYGDYDRLAEGADVSDCGLLVGKRTLYQCAERLVSRQLSPLFGEAVSSPVFLSGHERTEGNLTVKSKVFFCGIKLNAKDAARFALSESLKIRAPSRDTDGFHRRETQFFSLAKLLYASESENAFFTKRLFSALEALRRLGAAPSAISLKAAAAKQKLDEEAYAEYADLMTRDCADPDDGTLRTHEQVMEDWARLGFHDYHQDLID